MGKRKQRPQPRPKHKRQRVVAKYTLGFNHFEEMKKHMMELFKSISDKETLNNALRNHISKIEGYFRKYDTVQLLGGIGLYLIDNLNNIEKQFMSNIYGVQINLDEDAEVIAEYAMNFGLSMANEKTEIPSEAIIQDLR